MLSTTPESHRLYNKNPNTRHGKHPFEFLVRAETPKTLQGIFVALGCLQKTACVLNTRPEGLSRVRVESLIPKD